MMALEPGRRSVSPESSGRSSPAPRQWRNQLGQDDVPVKDKHYRKYATGVERALSLFDTALEEWADYISFLNRLLKALQARPSSITTIPAKSTVAKRLSQCLTPSLPSGVHQKALEVYDYVFKVIGTDGLSRDLPLYLPGIASTLSFASLSVRTPFLDILERYILVLNPNSLRPALKSIILALLPGLEDETAEDFERTLKLLEQFKMSVRPQGSRQITAEHAAGDDFFWQCFFLASITGVSRRAGALAYLARSLPKLGETERPSTSGNTGLEVATSSQLAEMVTSPEPGLLLRCFAAGLADDQLLIQRGYLDLLVTHLPLHSKVLQTRVKSADLELLLRAAVGVTIRRDMSLNRRLWNWLLGPEAAQHDQDGVLESPGSASGNHQGYFGSRTTYFEKYGLQSLTKALLGMIKDSQDDHPADKARPYRICLSLMDRWEIGGLVVPEVFLPIVDSVRAFKSKARTKADFTEVVRSASVFFDGVESGLIYSEMLGLLAQAIVPGSASVADRTDKLDLVNFILAHFNVREEEMITVHAPLTALAVLCMLDEAKERMKATDSVQEHQTAVISKVLTVIADLLEIVPERAFLISAGTKSIPAIEISTLASMPNIEILKRIKAFYLNEQGNLEAAPSPFVPQNVAELLLEKASIHNCASLNEKEFGLDIVVKSRILLLLLSKIPHHIWFDVSSLMAALHQCLSSQNVLPFGTYSSALSVCTRLHSTNRITTAQLTELVGPLVRHAWVFLSASEPKYHVETVRGLWALQTDLMPQNRDIEAAICSLMLETNRSGMFAARPAESGRSFTVLWAHSLQDNPSGADRRGPKTPNGDLKTLPRLAGMEHYDLMLTRPLLLMLDALADDRTQLFMTAKAWLHSLVGTDKIFKIFVLKLLDIPFLRREPVKSAADVPNSGLVQFTDDDDLDLALYYLRALSNVLRWAPEALWVVLARKTVSSDAFFPPLQQITGSEGDVTLQEFFVHACLKCIACENIPKQGENRVTQLYRCALTVLQQLLQSSFAEHLAPLHLDHVLIDRLTHSLLWPDPYIQVLLLDAVLASLKLRDAIPVELPTSPTNEKHRAMSIDQSKALRSSVSSEQPPLRHPTPPPTLLKCIQAGLSSANSRPVLDSWVNFLTECLPLYADSIFQVLIPLVETFCTQIGDTFSSLKHVFRNITPTSGTVSNVPENTLISLLNGLEQVLAKGHDRLLAEEARAQVVKSPDHPQGFFGNMVSGVFSSDAPQSRSATANDRLTVTLAFQDAVRICFTIWSWGQGRDASAQDTTSAASFNYTSLRMRNRARRLLEHLFAAETLECLETVIGIWRASLTSAEPGLHDEVLKLLPALDGSRPKHTVPALFNALYSRTNPVVLDPSRRSTLTIELQDTDIVIFLVDYAQSLEDDSMDEIWQDCMTFLKDLLGNPFPHRQTLPSLLEFAAILGEKVDNTNFGEQRKMRRELADLFLRLLTAIFTTRPSIAETSSGTEASEKRASSASGPPPGLRLPAERADDVVTMLSSIVPNLPKILVEPDRVLTAAAAISTNVIGPALRSKSFPDTVSKATLILLQELSRLPNNQKTWKKDVGDVFNDARFFGSNLSLVRNEWLPLLRQWIVSDKDRLPEVVGRIAPPTTAGIVFGVGATSARLEADRRTQLNLRRIATLILASAEDTFVTDLPAILDKLVELLGSTSTSSPSSTTRAEVFMVVRSLVLRTSPVHLAPLWPIINAELHAAISSVVAADHSTSSDTYNNASVLQACKLLDLLVCAAPDDFQLHEWLFVTDTIDAVYRPATYQPVALVDELSEELGAALSGQGSLAAEFAPTAVGPVRRMLLGPGGISDEVSLERKDELVVKILRPFFGQLSIFAFESTYAMGQVDWEGCTQGLLKDIFDERSIVKAL